MATHTLLVPPIQEINGRAAFKRLDKTCGDYIRCIQIEMLELCKAATLMDYKITLRIQQTATGRLQAEKRWLLRWRHYGQNTVWERLPIADLPVPHRRHFEAIQRRAQELSNIYSATVAFRSHIVKSFEAENKNRRDTNTASDRTSIHRPNLEPTADAQA